MAKNQRDYFTDKHPWSQTKDALLGCYLTPFFQKVYRSSRDGIVYVDAFAGAGKFEDGEPGSPLIALSKVQAIARTQKIKRPIQFIFAEARQELRTALLDNFHEARGNSRYIKNPIVCNDYAGAMQTALTATCAGAKRPSTVFYYVDPFGIKDLRMSYLLQSPNPQHTEVLVNFNSGGFLRAACAVQKVKLDLPQGVEVFDAGFGANVQDEERCLRLTQCVGSDGWIEIIRLLQEKRYDFWVAEYEIAKLFCRNASSAYRYVTNMPIKDMTQRVESGGLVKYRLIHMTNNADGCVLMNDNMLKRNETFQVPQPGLFTVDVDGRNVQSDSVARCLDEAVARLSINESIKMSEIAAAVISGCGVFERSSRLLKENVGPLLENGVLERVEKFTETGRPKQSFSGADLVYRIR